MKYEEIEKIAHRVCKDYTHAENESDRVYAFDKNTLFQFVRQVVDMSNQWMPIDTAPKDGTRYIAAYEYEGIWFCEVVGDHAVLTSASKVFPATHWMPLPPTPTR